MGRLSIVFLSGETDQESETKTFAMGAVDFINKPITPATVSARIKTHLALLNNHRNLVQQNQLLEEKIRERTHQIEKVQDAAIDSLSLLAEARDQETEANSEFCQSVGQGLTNTSKICWFS